MACDVKIAGHFSLWQRIGDILAKYSGAIICCGGFYKGGNILK
jgi:hypothetical protein